MTVERLADWLANTNPGFFIIAAALLMPMARDVVSRGILLVGGPGVALVALINAKGLSLNLSTVHVLGLDLVLYRPDSLSFVFGLAFIIGAAITGLYSLHRRDPLQDATAMIYAGAAVTAVFVGDLISMFVAWELTAIASVFQILAVRTRASGRSAMRYLFVQIASGLLVLVGVCMFAADAGKTQFALIAPSLAGLPVGVMDIGAPGALFLLAGFGVKAAFPLVHSWMQDAYPKASETGTVALSIFSTKLAIYALARYFSGLEALVWIGALMAVFPVFFAVVENDLRKALTYGLNSQLGFMVCAVGMGTQLAVNGAAAHVFVSVIYQSLLFMGTGAVLLQAGTAKATELGGLYRTMPWTALFTIIGAASMSAVPLLSGFVVKSMEMSAAHADHEQTVVWVMLLFASVGTVIHSGIRVPYLAFFNRDTGKRPQEAPFNMRVAMGVAAVLCLLVGLSPGWLYQFLPYQEAAIAYLESELWTPLHVIQQLEVLVFAIMAFMLLIWRKLYPAAQPGMLLDVEWLWRRGGLQLWSAVFRPAQQAGRAAGDWAGHLGGLIRTGVRQVFASDGWLAAKVPASASAIWSLAILGAVLVVALFG